MSRRSLAFLLLAPPLGLAAGAATGVVLAVQHMWRMERRLRKDWG